MSAMHLLCIFLVLVGAAADDACGFGRYCPVGTKFASPNHGMRDILCERRTTSSGGLSGGTTTEVRCMSYSILWDSVWEPSRNPLCKSCPQGAYCSSMDSCGKYENCSAGTYVNPSYVSSNGEQGQPCLNCAAGTWSSKASQNCTSCAAGTYIPSTASSSSSQCLSCAAGTYSPFPGQASCLLCTAGTYNPRQGSISSSSCLPCPAGTSSIAGATLCSPCAQNTYSAPGSSQCPACAPNTFSASGSGVCCPLGSWSAPASMSCTQCPAGTYSTTQGANSPSSCVQCPVGTYNPALASTSPSACQPCPPTTFGSAPGLLALKSCATCPPGSYSSTAGSFSCSACPAGAFCVNGSSLPCPLGTYSSQAGLNSSSLCTLCRAGTYNAVPGSVTLSACTRCDIGSFAPAPGTFACDFCPLGTTTTTTGAIRNTSCVPCVAGTYQDTLGMPCLACPINTFSTALGATSSAACQPCPDNGSTDAPGTPTLSLCKPFQCGPGLQPSTPMPLSPRDCTPINCPAPLSLSLDGTGCAGCGLGLYGTPPASCAPCPPNATCPGFFTLPLAAPASLAAAATAAGADAAATAAASAPSAACVAASRLPPTAVLIPNQPSSFALTNLPPLVTVCAAGGLAALVLALLSYAAHSPTAARARFEALLKEVDSFSMAHVVPTGSPLLNHPTALGGACSLLALLAFLTVAAVLILQYVYANVSVQTALNTLLSSNPFTPAVPWAPPLAPLAPPIASGLQLRLFAQEGLACDALAAGTGLSSSPSGWTVAPPQACGDGRTVLVLSCPTCSFSPTSFLKFYLPYTCQSFFLEAAAVDAQGVVNSVAFPPTTSVASPTALLSSLSWTVEVLGTIQKDTIKAAVSQGYQLSVSAAASYPAPIGTSIIPSKSLVALTVSLPLQTYYSATLLQPQQSLVSLVSSIVGLLGIIGLFRVLFLASETLSLAAAAAAGKRRQSTAPVTGSPALPPQQQQGGEVAVVLPGMSQTNPLRRGGGGGGGGGSGSGGMHQAAPEPLLVVEGAPTAEPSEASAATSPPAAAKTTWKRHKDGDAVFFTNGVSTWRRFGEGSDVWYYCEATKESVWRLPK